MGEMQPEQQPVDDEQSTAAAPQPQPQQPPVPDGDDGGIKPDNRYDT